MAPVVSVVLLDVGGTLWPDRWPEDASDQAERVAALKLSEPPLSDEQTREIVGHLAEWHHPPAQRQQTLSVVEAVVGAGGAGRSGQPPECGACHVPSCYRQG